MDAPVGHVEPDEVRAVRQVWTELGLPGVVDVHTHFMPERVLSKVWDYFDSSGERTGRDWPIAYRADDDTRVAILRAFGVRAFTSLSYAHKPGMAAWLNDWSLDFATRTPDCLPSATFYPEPGVTTYVDGALERGARVFKVHVRVGAFDPSTEELDPVWGRLADSGTPVVIHAGSGPVGSRFTGPGPIEAVLRRHPRARLVIAHMGMSEYVEFLDLAERFDRVHLDTTMAFTDYIEAQDPFPRDHLPRVATLGDRVLFGSDFPNIPYSYAEALQALRRLDLGDDWMRGVLHDNAARLFALGASG